jgi:hypothetical protein
MESTDSQTVPRAMPSPSVECYSGHTYAQDPRAFRSGDERRLVIAVRRRWREPAGPAFEVVADNGATYVLSYNEAADCWQASECGNPAQPREGY